MSETKYETRTLSVIVLPIGEEIYSERSTTVQITDEAGGEFVEVDQSGQNGPSKILINPEEWPTVRSAIDRMIGECRPVK